MTMWYQKRELVAIAGTTYAKVMENSMTCSAMGLHSKINGSLLV